MIIKTDLSDKEKHLRIRKQGTLQTLTQFPLKVNWSLTDMCNYSCSYCFGQLPIDRNRFSSLDQLRKAVSHIADANRDYYELIGNKIELIGNKFDPKTPIFPISSLSIIYIDYRIAYFYFCFKSTHLDVDWKTRASFFVL